MKNTVDFYMFERAFVDCGRKDSFTREGLEALFEYYENLEESLGQELELDPIAFCGEFAEYSDLQEIFNDYFVDSLKDLEDQTDVVPVKGGGYLVRAF